MANPEIVLRSKNLKKQVISPEGQLEILKGIDLEVDQGVSVAIVGPSGAGKSTLLALLAGLDEPSSGQVWLNGIELSALDEDGRARARASSVGFVFQSFHLIASFTALENVMLPLELTGNTNAKAAAETVLGRVGLSERLSHYPNQLSGGEQQRVAIARAFVTQPKVLFVDEPTGNLDQKTGQTVIELLFELNQKNGTTLLMVTHDDKLAARCERVITIQNGEMTADE